MLNRTAASGTLVSAVIGIAYWTAVSGLLKGGEPWDAAAYWTVVYPVALLISILLGAWRPKLAWLWGAIIVFAQVPVVIAVSGIGPLLLAGLVYAAVLSLPAMLVAWLGGVIRSRMLRERR